MNIKKIIFSLLVATLFLFYSCKKEELRQNDFLLEGYWEINTSVEGFDISKLLIEENTINFGFDYNKDGILDAVKTNDYYTENKGVRSSLFLKKEGNYKEFATFYFHEDDRFLYLFLQGGDYVIFERIK